jgi:tryptophanyl-tRNA synthetase
MTEDTQTAESESFRAAKERSDRTWAQIGEDPSRFRMLTGDRPTGPLHIGHYFGTLKNRVDLQNRGVETMVLVADYQVLTDREKPEHIAANVREVLLDYLAAGLDPTRSNTTIFCHSCVPELNQLMLPFLTLVSVPELERNPTVKEEVQAANLKVVSGSMFTYPVHQAADILFCKSHIVPVGKDQLAHLEITRKIARRFNKRYSPKDPVFPVPTALLSESPMILGLDGSQKMSKSRGNAILLKMSADETSKALMKAKTDSERRITYEPDSRPEVAGLLRLLALVTDESAQEWAESIADGGAGTLKKTLADALNAYFAPMRQRRIEFAEDTDLVQRVLGEGNEHARSLASKTMADVRRVMQMDYLASP